MTDYLMFGPKPKVAVGGDRKLGQPVNWGTLLHSKEFKAQMDNLKDAAKTGWFREEYGDEGFFEGDFLYGQRHGKGVHCFRNFHFEGEFKWGKMEGKGKRIEPDGSEYNGMWKEGREYGFGEYHNKENTFRFTGEWRCGKRHGYGKQEYPNGDVYEGEWEDGKYHGRGTYYYSNADKFTGLWTHGVKEGDGTLFFSNGSHSRRVYRNGVLHRVQDFDLQSGKYSGVVRREDVAEGGNKGRPTLVGSPRSERAVADAPKPSPRDPLADSRPPPPKP